MSIESNSKAIDLAKAIVYGDRNEDYGPPIEDFTCNAKMIEAYLQRKYGPSAQFKPEDFPVVMVLAKIARHAHKPKKDNIVDGIGYFECLDWIERGTSTMTADLLYGNKGENNLELKPGESNLHLWRGNIVKHRKDVPFEDVTLEDFNVPQEKIIAADRVVFYDENGSRKVLKDRSA